MAQSTARKTMTIGEGGTALVFAVTALLCLVGAVNAQDARSRSTPICRRQRASSPFS